MFPEVWERVTGLIRPGVTACFDDHAARCIRGQSYPALVPCRGALTEGIVYEDVTPGTIARLDDFEGEFYRRASVIIVREGARAVPACVYLAADPENPDILSAAWSAARFKKDSLRSFLQHDPGFTGGR